MVSSARELLQRRPSSQCTWWQEALRVEKAAAENQQLRAALAERTDFQLKGRSAPLGLFAVMPTGEERARAFSSDSSGSAKHCEAPLGPFLCGDTLRLSMSFGFAWICPTAYIPPQR